MYWKAIAAKPLFITLIFATVIGLLPMSSHMLWMQAMSMDTTTTFQAVASHTDMQGGTDGNLDGLCCDTVSPFSMVCDFVVSQSGYVVEYGGSKQVLNSLPIIQSIYIKAVIPPPKA